MGKSIAIIVSAILFAIIGLIAAFISSLNFEPRNEEVAMLMSFAPPAVGTVFGLFVGCTAVVCGHRLCVDPDAEQ